MTRSTAGEINDDLRPYLLLQRQGLRRAVRAVVLGDVLQQDGVRGAGIAAPPTTWSELESDLAQAEEQGLPVLHGAERGLAVVRAVPDVRRRRLARHFYTKLTENKATFDAPQVKQALTTWQKWIDNGWTTSADTKTA